MASVTERPESIQKLIDGVERYNPENLEVLEAYLDNQCKNGTYDLMANLAILKLYQFNPTKAKDNVVVSILAKSLTAIPSPDFNLCLYLLSERSTGVTQLTTLQQLLEQSNYAKFWTLYNDSTYKQLTSQVAGFEDAIRQLIARVITMSHQSISASVVQKYLALTGDAFTKFIQEQQWSQQGDVVVIPVNKDNEAKAIVVRENIKFEQLTKVIGYSNEM
ncbi:ARM repeat-containing protein [Hesseltinella vesiculosa]|uniref:Eukaryotic translation initiation factor 3 subunit K n=1 Tax=Hesseltinella vesiculosa TaxID=101127 RepID=A0A1X2GLF0_9FUNG|nr:ARM repeat-containing protein [Hesseltinella vesiculosa]